MRAILSTRAIRTICALPSSSIRLAARCKTTQAADPTGDGPKSIQKGEPVAELAKAGETGKSKGLMPAATLSTADLFSLRGRTIILTGAGRGIGLTIARAALDAGAHVRCLDILPEPLASEWSLAQDVAESKGATLSYHRVDCTDAEAVSSTITSLFETMPLDAPIRGVFAAAGIQQLKTALEYDAKDFRRLMDINVLGSFLPLQAAAREMIKRDLKGSLVMIASMSGSIANKGLTCTAYNTSKSALIQMARSLAAEWGQHGIRVNTLSPGYIRTALTDALLAERPDLEKIWLSGSLLDRLATPDELRGPAIYLLSDASSFATGSDVIVDGGHTAT